MGKLVVTSAAERDYANALKWYAERSLEAARHFDEELDRAIKSIAATPERFPKCDDRHRYFLLDRFPYQIIYRQFVNDWAIIAIAHAKQRPRRRNPDDRRIIRQGRSRGPA